MLLGHGLYELGDANFPWNGFPSPYYLPWQDRGAAGTENVFIGVPRLAYYLAQNALLALTHVPQVAQWLWYSLLAWIGFAGAYLLASEFAAGTFAFPLALLYSLNLWSYDRIAQGPVFMGYESIPLVLFLLVRYCKTPTLRLGLAFALSINLILPSLQVTYLAFVICTAIVVGNVLRRTPSPGTIVKLALYVAAGTAYFLLPAAFELLLAKHTNSLSFVSDRLGNSTFEAYAARATVVNSLHLASFYYASFERQMWPAQVLAWFPFFAAVIALNSQRVWDDRTGRWGIAFGTIGLFLVDGITLVPPPMYEWIRAHVPGLTLFVEPDYFMPLALIGGFLVLVAAAVRTSGRRRSILAVLTGLAALGGIIPFLPIGGPLAGLPLTPIPAPYREFSNMPLSGRTLWLPDAWVANFRWSPYVMNGFNVLNSPSSSLGPMMLEWTPPDTLRVNEELVKDVLTDAVAPAIALSQLMSVDAIALAADQYDVATKGRSTEIDPAIQTLRDLRPFYRSSLLCFCSERADLRVLRTPGALPRIGLYGLPELIWPDPTLMSIAAAARVQRHAPYRPMQFAREGTSLPGDLRAFHRRISVSDFDGIGNCSRTAAVNHLPRTRIVLRSGFEVSCTKAIIPLRRGDLGFRLFLETKDSPKAAAAYVVFTGPHKRVFYDGMRAGAPKVFARPSWASKVEIILIATQHHRAVYNGVDVDFMRVSTTPVHPQVDRCANLTSAGRLSDLVYKVHISASGQCTLVFRQSFSNVWSAMATSANVEILRHSEIDGYANGWTINAKAPADIIIFNVLTLPYIVGVILLALEITALAVMSLRNLAIARYAVPRSA